MSDRIEKPIGGGDEFDRYVEAAREAMESGNTTVVVHAFAGDQAGQAADFLRAQGGEVTSTL